MRPKVRSLSWLAAASLLSVVFPAVVSAHERFIHHTLKFPLHEEYFGRYAGAFLGIQPDMMKIATISTVLLAIFLVIFFFRLNIDDFVEHRLLSGLRGNAQRALHHLANFLTDKPVRLNWFHTVGEWAVVLFVRSPALVLMYSATNDSLVMPSYPLQPTSALYFKFIQAALAVLIITQTALPLVGAAIIGLWVYLFRWGWMVAADAIPVVTAGILYITCPWQSHRVAITELNDKQLKWVRLVLGFGFFALGWLKIYNYHLTAGVADNYPSVMNDPMIGFFSIGTNPAFRRENWIVAFALAEVLSGFMMMVGVFTRVWGTLMLWVFIKLMIVDFGWEEIPHIYPIAATAAVVFSNRCGSEFAFIERLQERARREGRTAFRLASVVSASIIIAALTIYVLVYALTFTNRSSIPGWTS